MSALKVHEAGRATWAKLKALQPAAQVSESDYEFAFCSGYEFAKREQSVADAKVIAELRVVVGPKLECGWYAVEHAPYDPRRRVVGQSDEPLLQCPRYAVSSHPAPPEYAEWRRSREGR